MSDYTTGQYKNALNASQKLGARRTTDFAATLFATPTDGLTIKARAHAWKDNDGPGAAFGYGVANGADVFNCNLGGTAGRVNGNNNWICGTPRFPRPDEIALDVVVTPEIKNILLGNAPIPPNTLQFIFTPQFLDHFGLERHAREASLIVNYEMQGGIVLSSITAAHSDKWAALDDLDKRPTAALGAALDSILLNNADFHDFSQEVRATSAANQSLRWLIGGSFADLKGLATSGFRLPPGTFRSTAIGSVNNAKSQGIFGSLAYDITDQLVINGEARRQYDKISDGIIGGLVLSKTFKSFTPRVILDYKPTDDITLYLSWAKGTRPGAFNPTLVGRPQSELDQINAAVGAAIAIPEERINNYEVGFKGKLWDGRASMTAALYTAKWRSQQSASAVPITRANGTFDLITVIGAGGKTNLSGVEVEAEARATEKLTVEGTFAFNRAHILTRDCSDCQLILGVNNAAGREMSRTPRYKGTASVTYIDKLVADYDWFTRADYIYVGDMFESEANATTTGASSKVNIRAGVENEKVRLEFYGTNIFNDKTFTGYQRLTDFSFAAGRSFLSVGLPNKPAYGARASYKF
ncbi:MAG: TonB-dependent receptor [Rhodospirillaceae bacterium]|nr:TonB-dependent receptor [Rhodospirillaceae bacterium]